MRLFVLAVATMGLPIGTALHSQAPTQIPPSATSAPVRIIMLRLYVSDIDRSEKFYDAVFGTNLVRKMGDHVRIMMLPGGPLPGIILIQTPEVASMHGSFVIQVPNLKQTLDRAVANGGTLKNTKFAEEIQGTHAESSHFTDPDGNLIEVLAMGAQDDLGKP